GKEVVQRYFVGYVNRCKAQAPLVAIAMKQVVVSYGYVEKIPRRDTWRILVVILRSRCWNLHQRRAKLRWIAQSIRTDSHRRRRVNISAEKPCLKLLIRRQP